MKRANEVSKIVQMKNKLCTQKESTGVLVVGYSIYGSTVHEVYMHTLTYLSLNSRRKSLHPQLVQNQCCGELTSK